MDSNSTEKCVAGNDLPPEDPLLTNEEITSIVEKAFGPDFEVTDCTFEHCGVGLFGSYSRLVIKAENSDRDKKSQSFFLKAIPYMNPSQTKYMKENNIFQQEVHFFNKIFPILTQGFNIPKWAAECYLAKSDVLVFDDLQAKGYVTGKNPLSLDATKTAMQTIARFHSSTILAEETLGKALNQVFPNDFIEKFYIPDNGKGNWMKSSAETVFALAEQFNLQHTDTIYESWYKTLDFIQPSKTHRNVICHNDLKTCNLMIDYNSEKVQVLCVDFERMLYVPLVTDLLQILYINYDQEFRKVYENEMIEIYHQCLVRSIIQNSSTARIPSLKEVFIAYEELRLFGVFSAAFYLPISLLDRKVFFGHKKSDNFEKWLHQDLQNAIKAYLNENEDYRTRIKSVISEYIDVSQRNIN